MAQASSLPSGPVRFERVTYLHGEAGRSGGGVHEIDLVLQPGQLVAVIGASGSGKTTFADLLAGLILPQTGAIRIGGEALNPTTLTRWRDAIAYVPQDSFLLNDTIRSNLLWGRSARRGSRSNRRCALGPRQKRRTAPQLHG